MQYTVSNGRMQITADTFGGELISIICDGKERLWQNQTGEWKRHAPILFPVAGHCDMRLDGKKYPMPAHGIAINAEFTLEEQGENYLLFSLSSNKETKKVYPFDFKLDVKYSIEDNVLTISQTVKNPAKNAMYFSLGGHESFVLEKPFSMHELIFEKEEEFIHLVHNPKGYLSGEKKIFGNGRKWILPSSFFINGKTIIFGNLKSRKVQIKERGGERRPLVNITFDGFENLLIWRDAGSNFLCVEPWLNLPDHVSESKEFSQKAGVVKLEGNSEKTYVRTMEYL